MPELDLLVKGGAPALSESSDGGASLANESTAPPPEKVDVPAPVETSGDEDVELDEAEEHQTKPEKAAKTPTRRDKGIAKILAREKETRAQLQQAMETIRSLAARQSPPQQVPPQQWNQPAPASQEADPKPKRESFEDPERYVESYAQWAARSQLRQVFAQAAAQQQQQSTMQANLQVMQSYSERVAKAAETLPDFEEVAQAQHLQINPVMGNVIVRLDNGPEVQYWLGKNPKEAERISRIQDLYRVAAELGKISEKITAKSSGEKAPSAAPRPVRSKAGTVTAGSRRSIYDPDLSMAEYIALRKRGDTE
jgi:hypothetical protein